VQAGGSIAFAGNSSGLNTTDSTWANDVGTTIDTQEQAGSRINTAHLTLEQAETGERHYQLDFSKSLDDQDGSVVRTSSINSSDASDSDNSWANSASSSASSTDHFNAEGIETTISTSSNQTTTDAGSGTSESLTLDAYNLESDGSESHTGSSHFQTTASGDSTGSSSFSSESTSTDTGSPGITRTTTSETSGSSTAPSHYTITHTGTGSYEGDHFTSDEVTTQLSSSSGGSSSSEGSASETTSGPDGSSDVSSTFSDSSSSDAQATTTITTHRQDDVTTTHTVSHGESSGTQSSNTHSEGETSSEDDAGTIQVTSSSDESTESDFSSSSDGISDDGPSGSSWSQTSNSSQNGTSTTASSGTSTSHQVQGADGPTTTIDLSGTSESSGGGTFSTTIERSESQDTAGSLHSHLFTHFSGTQDGSNSGTSTTTVVVSNAWSDDTSSGSANSTDTTTSSSDGTYSGSQDDQSTSETVNGVTTASSSSQNNSTSSGTTQSHRDYTSNNSNTQTDWDEDDVAVYTATSGGAMTLTTDTTGSYSNAESHSSTTSSSGEWTASNSSSEHSENTVTSVESSSSTSDVDDSSSAALDGTVLHIHNDTQRDDNSSQSITVDDSSLDVGSNSSAETSSSHLETNDYSDHLVTTVNANSTTSQDWNISGSGTQQRSSKNDSDASHRTETQESSGNNTYSTLNDNGAFSSSKTSSETSSTSTDYSSSSTWDHSSSTTSSSSSRSSTDRGSASVTGGHDTSSSTWEGSETYNADGTFESSGSSNDTETTSYTSTNESHITAGANNTTPAGNGTAQFYQTGTLTSSNSSMIDTVDNSLTTSDTWGWNDGVYGASSTDVSASTLHETWNTDSHEHSETHDHQSASVVVDEIKDATASESGGDSTDTSDVATTTLTTGADISVSFDSSETYIAQWNYNNSNTYDRTQNNTAPTASYSENRHLSSSSNGAATSNDTITWQMGDDSYYRNEEQSSSDHGSSSDSTTFHSNNTQTGEGTFGSNRTTVTGAASSDSNSSTYNDSMTLSMETGSDVADSTTKTEHFDDTFNEDWSEQSDQVINDNGNKLQVDVQWHSEDHHSNGGHNSDGELYTVTTVTNYAGVDIASEGNSNQSGTWTWTTSSSETRTDTKSTDSNDTTSSVSKTDSNSDSGTGTYSGTDSWNTDSLPDGSSNWEENTTYDSNDSGTSINTHIENSCATLTTTTQDNLNGANHTRTETDSAGRRTTVTVTDHYTDESHDVSSFDGYDALSTGSFKTTDDRKTETTGGALTVSKNSNDTVVNTSGTRNVQQTRDFVQGDTSSESQTVTTTSTYSPETGELTTTQTTPMKVTSSETLDQHDHTITHWTGTITVTNTSADWWTGAGSYTDTTDFHSNVQRTIQTADDGSVTTKRILNSTDSDIYTNTADRHYVDDWYGQTDDFHHTDDSNHSTTTIVTDIRTVSAAGAVLSGSYNNTITINDTGEMGEQLDTSYWIDPDVEQNLATTANTTSAHIETNTYIQEWTPTSHTWKHLQDDSNNTTSYSQHTDDNWYGSDDPGRVYTSGSNSTNSTHIILSYIRTDTPIDAESGHLTSDTETIDTDYYQVTDYWDSDYGDESDSVIGHVKSETALSGDTVSGTVTSNKTYTHVYSDGWIDTYVEPGHSISPYQVALTISAPQPDDPLNGVNGDPDTEWKGIVSGMVNQNLLHMVDGPGAAAANADSGTSAWDWAKWLTNPIGHFLAEQARDGAAMEQAYADQLSSDGNVLGGTLMGMFSKATSLAAGIIDKPAGIIDAIHNGIVAGERAAAASDSKLVGVLAGVGYSAGSMVGLTQVAEAVINQDFATGQSLGNWIGGRGERLFGGISAAAVAGAGALESMKPVMEEPFKVCEGNLSAPRTAGPNIVGTSGNAWTVEPSAQSIISCVAQQQANMGAAGLRSAGYLSPRQWAAYSVNPANGSRFLGSAVHEATAATLRQLYPGRFLYNRVGPDFIDTMTGEVLELTTPGQVRAHMAKPGYRVTYSTYDLP
jgi:hypothetical protein